MSYSTVAKKTFQQTTKMPRYFILSMGTHRKKTLNPAPKHFRRISLFLYQMLLSQSHNAWLAHMFLSFFGGVKLLSTKKKTHSINSLDFLLNYPPGTSSSHLRPNKETIKTAIFRCKIAVSFRDGNSPFTPRHPVTQCKKHKSCPRCSRRLILCAKPFHWANVVPLCHSACPFEKWICQIGSSSPSK